MASRLPEGGTLSPEVFEHRHRLLQVVLALHVPGLLVFALARGVDPLHAATASVAVPVACLALSAAARGRRIRAVLVTAGLLWCSTALVWFAGGSIEARFHVFVVLAAISLYQDWVPFGFTIVYAILSNGLSRRLGAGAIFGVGTVEQRHPWTWAAVEGAAIVGAAVALLVGWKESELERTRSASLARELTRAEDTAQRRRMVGDLLVSLARRNQALLERQLDTIDELEAREEDPATLSDLFRLDHLATRMRRNAENLLVLAGNEPIRRWREAVAASEVARGAAAEIEDYTRVDVVVTDDPPVAGHAVADVAHLLAELLENATVFSPPDARVAVHGRFCPQGYEIRVEDRGLGMNVSDRSTWNDRLGAPPELEPDLFGTLGLHVVGRLAARHAIAVRLEPSEPEGATAVVVLPPAILTGLAATSEDAAAAPDSSGTSVALPVLEPRRGRHWISTRSIQTVDGDRDSSPTTEPEVGTEAARLEAERRFLGSDPRPPATPSPSVGGPDAPSPLVAADPEFADPRHPAGRALVPGGTHGPDVLAGGPHGPDVLAGGTHGPDVLAGAADEPVVLDQRVPRAHLAPGIAANSPNPARRRGGPDPDRVRERLQRFQQGVEGGRRITGAPTAASGETGPSDPLVERLPSGEGGDGR